MEDSGTDAGAVDRRSVLKLLEAMGVASLAGCLGGGDGDERDTPTEVDTPIEGDTPTDEPPDGTDTPPGGTDTPTTPTEPGDDDDTIDVLFLGGPSGGSHDAPARSIQIIEYLQNRGIGVVYTDRQDDLTEDVLHRYDAWMLYDNRSDLTQTQEDSLISFVENGGGFVALHSASACFTGSNRFIEHLGGQFESHGEGIMRTEHRQPDHPVLTGIDPIESWDETYNHTNVNPDNEVLAVHTEDGEEPEPWTWVREEGSGRVFYTAWGHDDRTWSKPGFKKLVENAIRWTAGHEDTISAGDTSRLASLRFTDAEVPYYPADGDDTVPPEVGSGMDWNEMQEPLSPERTAERVLTPNGFDLEYFLTEETLPDGLGGNILDFDFDHRGRVYLAVSQDYPNAVAEGGDSIVIAEDTDDDGRADEFTVFESGLSIPNSITVAYGGVYVANTGHTESEGAMLFLEDTNGDDRADETTVLFSGFNNGDTHAGPNELTVGIDNWLWGQVGYSGFAGSVGGTQHNFSSAIYRFRPDGSELQVLGTLPGNQAGLGFDEEGLAFASAATSGQPSNYLAIPGPYYDSISSISSSGFTTTISDQNRFLPVTDRVRQVDQHGGYTAATGQTIYTARQYPEKYWNQATLVSDGTGHLLGCFFKQPDGAGFTAHNPHNVAASTDAWFSPTYSKVGPDGNVWFADLYEYIFQHNPTPSGFENGEGNAYETILRDKQYTRLPRLVYGDDDGQQLDLGDAEADEFVDALSHDNMFWRRTAQRLLVERGETDVVEDLLEVLENATADDIGIAKGAVHALWALEGLGVFDENPDADAIRTAADALGHDSPAVRMTASRVLPQTIPLRDGILDNDLLEDDNPRVRMWALLGLAGTPASSQAGEAIYEMISAEENAEDDVLIDAASIAGASHPDGFIDAYEKHEDTGGGDDPSSNLFTNPGFEETRSESGSSDDSEPADWETNTYGGSAEYTYVEGTANGGDHSLRISSEEGADAVWRTTVSVDPDTEYTLGGYVKTENVDVLDDTGFSDITPFGALFNVDQVGGASDADVVAGPLTGTNDWTEVSTTLNSGDTGELTVNCLFGGFGEATGTAWYDDIYLEDPDGNNLLPNADFETEASTGGGDDGGTVPAGWEPIHYAGAEPAFTHESSTSRNGEYSVAIESSEGSDSSWSQVVDVEPNTQYEFSARIKTGEDFTETSGFGALINVDELQQDPLPDPITESGQDWTEVSVVLNSGSNQELQFNLLYGGWGEATGKVRWDDASLRRIGGGGAGVERVYDRVVSHAGGARDDDDANGGTGDVIDPGTTIELGGETGGWVGQAPAAIAGTTNPALPLEAGETYTVEWENLDGIGHNFEILASDDPNGDVVDGISSEIMSSQGETQTVEFTATDEMARYQCSPHRTTMEGRIETS
jgi:putative membrane-bound dehydrogenase-like protein